jgi:hypothetical protein
MSCPTVAKLIRARRLLDGGASPGVVAEHTDLALPLVERMARGEITLGLRCGPARERRA